MSNTKHMKQEAVLIPQHGQHGIHDKGIVGILRWTLAFIMRYALVFWGCIAINMVGTVLGTIFWYGTMLMTSPLWTLPFIPDCPLAALLGSIALVGLRWRKGWAWFTAFAAFACIKYGAWTIMFWLRQWWGAGELSFIGGLLLVSHVGLLVEGLLLVPHIGKLALSKRVLVIGWFAFSIYVDYGLGYDPGMASHVPLSFGFWVAVVLTTVLGVSLLLLPQPGSSLAR